MVHVQLAAKATRSHSPQSSHARSHPVGTEMKHYWMRARRALHPAARDVSAHEVCLHGLVILGDHDSIGAWHMRDRSTITRTSLSSKRTRYVQPPIRGSSYWPRRRTARCPATSRAATSVAGGTCTGAGFAPIIARVAKDRLRVVVDVQRRRVARRDHRGQPARRADRRGSRRVEALEKYFDGCDRSIFGGTISSWGVF